jgi:hypothetical protein
MYLCIKELFYLYIKKLRCARKNCYPPNRLVRRKLSRLVWGRCSVRTSVGIPAIPTEIFLGFPQSLQTISRILPQLGHDRIFPKHLLSIIIHLSSCHWTLHNLRYWKLRKINHKTILEHKENQLSYHHPVLNNYRASQREIHFKYSNVNVIILNIF